MSFVVIKTGSTIPELRLRGDFEDWFAAGLGCQISVFDAMRGDPLPRVSACTAIVITGSPAMVSHGDAWAMALAPWLAEAVGQGVPTLGVCYGHQLLAYALGGKVGPNPRGRQIGTIKVHMNQKAAMDPVLGFLAPSCEAQATHVESVLEPPPGAQVLGNTDLDPHHVLQFGERAWGVQFHPEFNAGITRGYIRARAKALTAEGLDPADLAERCRDTPIGPQLLRRFASLHG